VSTFLPKLSSLDKVSQVLFSQGDSRATVAYYAISRGVSRAQDGDYEGAIVEFQRAAAVKPDLIEAFTYMGQAYTALGRPDSAVDAYKRALAIDTTSVDARTKLANAYVSAKRYGDAEEEYKRLTRMDPTSPGPVSSLGLLYLQTDRPSEAEAQLLKAVQLAPSSATAYDNLGRAQSKLGKYDQAIAQFQRAIALDPKDATAYAELGKAYLALDQPDEARDQLKALGYLDTSQARSLAADLGNALYTPKIVYADTVHGTFNTRLGPGTPLSQLDPSLATPGAAKTFTVVFQFNQNMDPVSVQDILNWTISKAQGGDGGVYDNGVSLHPRQEVGLLPYPLTVQYDAKNMCATVSFVVHQNAAGDGVIDPSHWVFQFTGTDASGRAIDHRADEFDGWNYLPF
jgi:tetratricopeptide (TPR) repeat protein